MESEIFGGFLSLFYRNEWTLITTIHSVAYKERIDITSIILETHEYFLDFFIF